jgi:hypothetical protein
MSRERKIEKNMCMENKERKKEKEKKENKERGMTRKI